MGNQFVCSRHINPIHVGIAHRWRRGGKIDFFRACIPSHLHDLLGCGATHDGIVDQHHILAFKF